MNDGSDTMTSEFVPIFVGHSFSASHTFEKAQTGAFALSAGDTNPLHHDENFALSGGYDTLVVSGTHTTALLMGLTASHFAGSHSVVGLSFFVELRRPVLVDATVSMVWHVTAVTANTACSQDLLLRGAMCDAQGRECVTALGRCAWAFFARYRSAQRRSSRSTSLRSRVSE